MSNSVSNSKTCPRCGAPLSDTALDGLCPRCLLAANLTAGTAPHPEGTPAKGGFLSIEELSRLFPQLEIQRLLGEGGMGVVYLARQPELDRLVALKILKHPGGGSGSFAERFLREARSLAKLKHPNIVTVHDLGVREGHYYLLMEHVDGLNLRELIRSKSVTPAQALGIVPKICDALQYAHDQGIVHRDIKPENILIERGGCVKIADFGIAKLLDGEAGAETLTAAFERIGTPHYMAPEQVETPQKVDHRADIYSLGVVFYELLTGELPLGRFPPPSQKLQVDLRLDEVVLHALEKQPERRYQHASEVKTSVETIAATPAAKHQSSGARGLLGALLVLLVLGSSAGAWWYLTRGDRPDFVMPLVVLDSETGKPIPMIWKQDNYGEYREQAHLFNNTDAEGRVRFTYGGKLWQGIRSVSVGADGYITQSQPPASSGSTLVFRLKKAPKPVEPDPDVRKELEIELEQALRDCAIVREREKAGLVSRLDVLQANARRDLIKARLAGDSLQEIQIHHDLAKQIFAMAKSRYDAGLSTQEELQKAETELKIWTLRIEKSRRQNSDPK